MSTLRLNPQKDDDMESTYTKIFIRCKVLQTEVHDGPYPPRSRCKSLLIRFKNMVVSGCFEFDPPRFVYNFNPERVAHDASKIWVNTSTQKQYTEAIICAVLGHMGIDEKDHPAMTKTIFEAVEMAVPLPQLAIDVTIWNMVACVFGSFDYHDDVLYRNVRKSWASFNGAAATCSTQMPPSCVICLEDFGDDSVDDKLITRLPCLHYFHGHCAARWVKTHHTCPLCRDQIIPILCDENGPSKPNPSGVELCPQVRLQKLFIK